MEKGQTLRSHLAQQCVETLLDQELADVLLDLVPTAKAISCEVNRAGLADILGVKLPVNAGRH